MNNTGMWQPRPISRRDRLIVVMLSIVLSMIALRPFIGELSAWRGDQYSDEHQYRDALRSYRKASLLAPENATVHDSTAFALSRLGRRDDAIREYRLAVALEPENTMFHYYLAVELLYGEEQRDALKHMEISRDLDPKNFAGYRGLIALYDKFGQPEQARRAERMQRAAATRQEL